MFRTVLIIVMVLILFRVTYGQKNNVSPTHFFEISIDSIDCIIIKSERNNNYEQILGESFCIERKGTEFILNKISEYAYPYKFGNKDNSFNLLNNIVDSVNLVELLSFVNQYNSSNFSKQDKITFKHNFISGKKIPNHQISSLLKAITNIELSYSSKLLYNLNIDCLWLNENAENIWLNYKPKHRKIKKRDDNKYIEKLKNYSTVLKISQTLYGSPFSSDYPSVKLQIIAKRDTFKISTEGQYPYMLPWKLNNKFEVFNPNISIVLSAILEEVGSINIKRLKGEYGALGNSFEQFIVDKLVEKYSPNGASM